MTIREIAKAANVSPATVSRVLNEKPNSASQETRERILRLAKELHYIPFASYRQASQNSLLLGVLLDSDMNQEGFLTGLVKSSRDEGYSTIVCSSNTPQEELSNLVALISRNVDGIVWGRSENSLPEIEEILRKEDIPFLSINPDQPSSEDNLYFDYQASGMRATEELLCRNHMQVLCVSSGSGHISDRFYEGYQQAMFQRVLQPLAPLLVRSEEDISMATLYNCTGVVCENYTLATWIYQMAQRMNLCVPETLSILCLNDTGGNGAATQQISTLPLMYRQLGHNIIHRLLCKIEGRQMDPEVETTGALTCESTVGRPDAERSPRVVVLGTLNMDTLIRLHAMPETGQTTSTIGRIRLPGGKALNQAIGCRKLGADTILIGKLGKDYDGSVIHNYLQDNHVLLPGISVDPNIPTGSAYIYVLGDGESSIVIDRGANDCLTQQDIKKNEHLFHGAGFCLLQTELAPELALCAARIARQNGVKVILKPCAQTELGRELLQLTDYLIPNRRELHSLCPGDAPLAEKARSLLEGGASHVIVTLGAKGCFLKDAEHERYFPALQVPVVDTTGASDAFAAGLAVYLLRGNPLERAIEYAICASGISTMSQGVPPSLPDQHAVELYMQGYKAGNPPIPS